MSLTKEIITSEEYKEFQPDFVLLNIPEESLQSCINTTFLKLEAKCGGMISLVWDITDENDPNFRTKLEHDFIKRAMLLQTQTEVAFNNDPTGGQTSISTSGTSYSETRQRDQDTQILPMVFDLLVKARVYFEQIAVETRLSNNNGDDFENLNPYDGKYEKDPISMSQADQRYIRKYQNPLWAGKVATIESNGLVVWNDIPSSTVYFKDIKGDPRENVELFNEFEALEGAIMETDVQLEAVKTQLTNKADTTYVNTELSKKADKTELTTLETKVDANTTSITNLQNTKADKTELNDYVKKDKVIVEGFNILNTSHNLSQGSLKYFTEADGGNPWIETSSYRPIRSGQIIVSNKYNGTSLTQPGNRWYVSGGLIANIPEVNDNRKVIKFPMDQNMPSYVVANNVDALGYSIRFDSATHSNVDTQIIFGIGASNQKKEGYMTCPIRGYYVRNNNTYQLVQFNLYFEFGELDGREFLALWGSCMGRDRAAYFNTPTDVASTGYAPQNYVLNYRVYNKEQI